MSGAPACLPGRNVRPGAHGFSQGHGTRSCLACTRASPSVGCKPRNHNFNRHPGGRCAAAPAKRPLARERFAAQNTRLEKILRMQGERRRARAQVVEAYREIAASTTNSRQGQYIITTSGIMIRRPVGISSLIRSGLRVESTRTATLVEIRFPVSIPPANYSSFRSPIGVARHW